MVELGNITPKKRGRPTKAEVEARKLGYSPVDPERQRFTMPGFDTKASIPDVDEPAPRPKSVSSASREAEDYARMIIESGDAIPVDADVLAFPTHKWPDGWEYMWRALTVAGQPQGHKMNDLKRNHWREVPRDRHPEEPTDDPNASLFIRGGLLLMEIPKVIADIRRAGDQQKANEQLENARAQLGEAPTEKFGPQARRSRPQLSIETMTPDTAALNQMGVGQYERE